MMKSKLYALGTKPVILNAPVVSLIVFLFVPDTRIDTLAKGFCVCLSITNPEMLPFDCANEQDAGKERRAENNEIKILTF